ncbi:uncharacterized protein FFFS_10633 [Fusarium fujikuroi]|nr:uncharacterized protein FFFS_10633 [Fusarium fujikuroi]
MPQDLIIALNY